MFNVHGELDKEIAPVLLMVAMTRSPNEIYLCWSFGSLPTQFRYIWKVRATHKGKTVNVLAFRWTKK